MIIIVSVLLMIILFFLWTMYCYKHCSRIIILLTSTEILVPFIFLVYTIFAPIFFVIEGKSLADRYFYISELTMQKTCILHFGIYVLFFLLMLLGGLPKKLSFRESNWAQQYYYGEISLIWDGFAVLVILYYLMKIYYAGRGFIQLDTLEKRAAISSEFLSYLNIYMVTYTIKLVVPRLISLRRSNNNIRVIIPFIFWSIYLFVTSRRYFLMVFPVIIFSLITKEGKNIKWFWGGMAAVIGLLVMGAKRSFISFSAKTLVYFLHNSLAEFIYPYYTSCYFIGHGNSYLYGSSYIFDTFTKWIPRVIYENKPLDLSERFWNMAKTNVAFSFSPVAEGVYNYGWIALFFVPLILFAYVKITNNMLRYSSILYMTFLAYFINFMRGSMSNTVMDLAMISFLMCLMNIHSLKLYIFKKKKYQNIY